MGTLLSLIAALIRKFAGAALIAALALGACGLWVYLKDNVDFHTWQQDMLRAITGERTKIRSALEEVNARLTRIAAEIAAEQARDRQAEKVVTQLKALESTWDRLVGNPAQQQANAEQLAKMIALRESIAGRREQLEADLSRATWERDGLQIALGKVEAKLQAAEAQQSRFMHYLERIWNYPLGREPLRLELKWWLLATLVAYFAGPTLWKTLCYFLVAPFIVRRRPVRFAGHAAALPEVSESQVSTDLSLGSGERLWIKEPFLQASDEGLARRTRYLLDWRVPFTCLATGLVELIEMRHPGGGAAAHRLTLSNQRDPHSELAVITLVEGAALILRPSFLAGVVTTDTRRLVIRRRWALFRWQSWVTLQFRFFEFRGPCRLIVAGKRGVRIERLADREAGEMPARRTNQEATMGFTPNLDYRPARAETFWSYYRGMNPLFDDLFAGRGLFLCQKISASGQADESRKFWAAVRGGALKVFGI